ncbi:unnamed protein product [Anisakis simplex]|uniref:Transmembrane protein 107 n=1 Tax=Anisakis simplex TaxID=6269 RepID=A0A0M3J3T4_ANISI|nr:unnamed protein product [Anisakis simplex]
MSVLLPLYVQSVPNSDNAGLFGSMNIFRLTADLAHLIAIFILAIKMWKTRSVAGISGRSQVMFAAVFTSRYLDLFTNFISFYNSAMKVSAFLTYQAKFN